MVITASEALALSEKVLAAWNRQDVEGVVACYTEDCVYLDPNTRGPVEGRESPAATSRNSSPSGRCTGR